MNGYHTRTTLRDFAGRERYLFLRPSLGIRVRRWIRKLMGGREMKFALWLGGFVALGIAFAVFSMVGEPHVVGKHPVWTVGEAVTVYGVLVFLMLIGGAIGAMAVFEHFDK